MAWQSSTIDPATTSPATDISKITNDLSVLKGVIGGSTDTDVPVGSALVSKPTHSATEKTAPVDADELGLVDSAATYSLKRISWANIKAAIRSYLIGASSTWSAVQKTTVTTNNSLTHDLSLEMDISCTPTGSGTLAFTNVAAGQKFEMLFTNSGNYAIAKGSNIKCPSSLFTTISATGRYIIAGRCLDGANVDLTVSGALS